MAEMVASEVDRRKDGTIVSITYRNADDVPTFDVPQVCSGCLGKVEADEEVVIKSSNEVLDGMTKVKRTVSMSVPVCSQCAAQQASTSRKIHAGMAAFGVLCGAGAGYLLHLGEDGVGLLVAAILGLFAGVCIIYGIKGYLSPLAEGASVRFGLMEKLDDIKVHFDNGEYAELFLKANPGAQQID